MEVKVNELLGKCSRNYNSDDFKDVPKSDTFFFCTIREAKYLQSQMLGTVAYDGRLFDVSSWLPMIKGNALNWNNSYYLHAAQLSEREVGMFCRSDSGDKEWSGQLIQNGIDVGFVKSQVAEDEMMFVSPRRTISCEWRIWMANGRCVASTEYENPFIEYRGDKGSNEKAVQFAVDIAKNLYEPDERYVVDVAFTPDGYKVVEYNAYSTSGFYGVDAEKLISNTIDSFAE